MGRRICGSVLDRSCYRSNATTASGWSWDQIVNDSLPRRCWPPSNPMSPKSCMRRSALDALDRDLTCGFYYDFFQGTMANPMIAACNNTAQTRAAAIRGGLRWMWPRGSRGGPVGRGVLRHRVIMDYAALTCPASPLPGPLRQFRQRPVARFLSSRVYRNGRPAVTGLS